MKYSILVMTYYKRFDAWFKPLIIEIKRQRPDIEIIVGINGELDHFNEEYRKSMLDFLKDYKNVFPCVYPRFRSFSRKVNLGVQFASEDIVLVLSDDITLEDWFFNNYEHVLESHQIFAINMSFSVFSITKKIMTDVGWLDERLLGMGWEDGEFIRNYIKCKGEKFPNTVIEQCKNCAEPTFPLVYNKRLHDLIKIEKTLDGHKVDWEFARYSEFNRIQYESDVPHIDPYPLEKFYLENRDKLKI